MYSRFIRDQALSEISTLGIGGPARYFYEVKSIEIMQQVMRFCHLEKLPFFILGKGSNCLFSDYGFDGLVILNKIDFCDEIDSAAIPAGPMTPGSVAPFGARSPGANLCHPIEGFRHFGSAGIAVEPATFYVGAGFSFSLLGTQTARKGYSGLEFASGIPATVGGAIFMNAGAQSGETQQFLKFVDYVDDTGEMKRLQKDELHFSYRYSSFQSMRGAIVAACFQLVSCSEAKVLQRALLDYRIATQPYHEKSAGCIFRNPSEGSAGALIDKCGLKGFQIGGAKVSEMHGNFLVNSHKASADDMKALIRAVQQTVYERCGVHLEQEVRVIE